VAFLKDAVRQRIRYLSLAGVNFGYSRYNYDLFLEVLRPHLKLARSVDELRRSLAPDAVASPATKAEVREWLLEERHKRSVPNEDPPVPLNAAGRAALFGHAPDGCRIRRRAAVGDGEIGPRFHGAYTDPFQRTPVRATFGRDFGVPRILRSVTVVPCLHPDETTYVATDLRLERRVDDEWKMLPGGEIRDNRRSRVRIEFAPLEAEAVRVVIESETDDGKGNYRACCQELSVE
jgi:hypothetical protein